jgi:hypothetical protein
LPVDQGYIDALIANPRETLSVEIKDWIDPRSAHGQAKIVKACLAMRNQNGGFLQVGFEDGTWTPNASDAPADARAEWDADEIQGLVSRFASELFEVHLHFGNRDGRAFPVLEVGRGVTSPVASKRDLVDPQDPSSKLVKKHAVYVRSLSSSGRAATSEAQHGDWPRLTRRCFDNLEADVGRFARRQLGGIDPEAARVLAEALAGALDGRAAGPAEPSPAARTITTLHEGFDRFQRERTNRNLDAMPRHGALEAAAVVGGPEVPDGSPTEEFLNRLNAANPGYTGWPLWVDSRGFDDGKRPYTLDGGWEALIYDHEPGSPYNHLDFWRAEPGGRFYAYRGFEDDVSEGSGYPEAMTTLDFGMAIWRVAEAVAVPLAFALAMELPEEETTVFYAFRWSGLRGRRLSSWTNPARSVFARHESRQNVVESPPVAVPLDTPDSALGPFVREATTGLFAAFGGFEPGPGVTEGIVDEVMARGRRAR